MEFAMISPYIQFFDDQRSGDIAFLGGKCASLVALTAAEMPVPPGFAVTTTAFDEFIDGAGLAAPIEQLLADVDAEAVSDVDRVSAQIRDWLCSHPMPGRIRDDFAVAYDQLQARFARPVPVAVRSSATAEDLPDASFAGQQDTYLWLTDLDSVDEHVRRCWASLYTSRAITYRLKNHIPNEGLSMSVAVQKMVNARVAGVAMTLDPTTGDRSMIAIDASWGVGESVVSGIVTPDNIKVDKVMLTEVERIIGDKHLELVPDTDAGSLVEREVAPTLRDVCCLSHSEIQAIARIAKLAERHFGRPQDIEWALDADLPDGENLMLLQSRPETVWSTRSETISSNTGVGIGAITQSLMAQIGR